MLEWGAIAFSRQATYSQKKTRLGVDYGSDIKLLLQNSEFKLKKVGKTIRPFRYELNKIPYDYTVEVTNRLKGLDLIDRVLKKYGRKFVTLYRRQCSKPSRTKRNAKRQNGIGFFLYFWQPSTLLLGAYLYMPSGV